MLPPDIHALLESLARIPYENLSKAVRFHANGPTEKIMREPEWLIASHQRDGTGGTCFSLTWYLYCWLRDRGFQAYPVMCDRTYGPNTHCCAVLEHGGEKYLLDPGFLSFAPIHISGKPASLDTAYNTITLTRTDDRQYQLHTAYLNERKYRFTLKDEPVSEEAFLEHWRKSFHLESLTYPVATMLKDNTHLYFQKENLFVRTREGSERIRVPMAKMPEILEKYFGIKAAVTKQALEVFY